jgi:hypothetical protein
MRSNWFFSEGASIETSDTFPVKSKNKKKGIFPKEEAQEAEEGIFIRIVEDISAKGMNKRRGCVLLNDLVPKGFHAARPSRAMMKSGVGLL